MSVSFFGVAETEVTGPRGPAGPQPTISTYIGTYHTLAGVAQIMSNFPSVHTPSNGKIRITNVWFERDANHWFNVHCGRFNRDWPDFHLTHHPTVHNGQLVGWMGGAPLSHWSRRFRVEYIEYS